jgi:hypothetical protein
VATSHLLDSDETAKVIGESRDEGIVERQDLSALNGDPDRERAEGVKADRPLELDRFARAAGEE